MRKTDGGNKMFYCVARLTFDPDSTEAHDAGSLGRFARRVRERFGVAAAPEGGTARQPVMGLVVAAVGEREDRLSDVIESIARFCEDDGFARVVSESSFIDPVE